MTCYTWSITVRWTPAGVPVFQTGHDILSLRTAGVGLATLLDLLPLPVLAQTSLAITFNDLSLDGSGLVLFADPPDRLLWREPHTWMIAHPASIPHPCPTLDDAILHLYTARTLTISPHPPCETIHPA